MRRLVFGFWVGAAAVLFGCQSKLSVVLPPAPEPCFEPSWTLAAVPIGANTLQPWLASGCYRSWSAWSKVKESERSDKGVRVFLSPALVASLKAENKSHPQGVAAVREMYKEDHKTLRGWSVTVKADADSRDGDGWYFYEVFDTRLPAAISVDQNGASSCLGCHSHGTDFVYSTLPLP